MALSSLSGICNDNLSHDVLVNVNREQCVYLPGLAKLFFVHRLHNSFRRTITVTEAR